MTPYGDLAVKAVLAVIDVIDTLDKICLNKKMIKIWQLKQLLAVMKVIEPLY